MTSSRVLALFYVCRDSKSNHTVCSPNYAPVSGRPGFCPQTYTKRNYCLTRKVLWGRIPAKLYVSTWTRRQGRGNIKERKLTSKELNTLSFKPHLLRDTSILTSFQNKFSAVQVFRLLLSSHGRVHHPCHHHLYNPDHKHLHISSLGNYYATNLHRSERPQWPH